MNYQDKVLGDIVSLLSDIKEIQVKNNELLYMISSALNTTAFNKNILNEEMNGMIETLKNGRINIDDLQG